VPPSCCDGQLRHASICYTSMHNETCMESLARKHASQALDQQPNARKGAGVPMSPGARTAQASCPSSTAALRSEFPGSAQYVGQVRRWLRANLGACPAVDDAVLLASELVTNALEHSASGRSGSFVVAVHHRSADMRVEVADQGGPWLPGDTSNGLHGRGLVIVGTVARAGASRVTTVGEQCGSNWTAHDRSLSSGQRKRSASVRDRR
jgi:serine/threonine-protein kinase RsbW